MIRWQIKILLNNLDCANFYATPFGVAFFLSYLRAASDGQMPLEREIDCII